MTNTELIARYEAGESVKQLAKSAGIVEATLYKRLRKSGIPLRRRHSLAGKYRDDRFERIETPEDAYWLGFLYSDGCVSTSGVVLSLHTKDRVVLEQYCDYMGASYSKIKVHGNVSRVVLGAQMYIDRLIRLGCIPHKTKILEPPPITDPELIQAFLKGYYHGDGHISTTGRYIQLGIACGNRDFLQWVSDQLQSIVPHTNKVRLLKNHWGEVFTISLNGKRAKALLSYWDSLTTPQLPRKTLSASF